MNAVLNKKKCIVTFDHYEDNNNVAIQLVKKRKEEISLKKSCLLRLR